MSDDELLSRYLDGDLTAADADRLRERLQAEPALVARLDALRALVIELEALPEVLPGAPAPPRRAPSRWVAAVVGVAAALAMGVGYMAWNAYSTDVVAESREAPRVHLALHSGAHRVHGSALQVQVGGLEARVDGEVVLRVEPGGVPARRRGQEDVMDLSHAASAGAGAVVSVVVLSGVALVWPDGDTDAEPVRIEAGDAARPFAIEGDVPVDPGRQPRPTGAGEMGAESVETELARLRFENELLRGQLALIEGEPVPFPADVPAVLSVDGFAEHAHRVDEGVQGLELLRVDCSEFPCLAVLTAVDPSDEEGLRRDLEAFNEALGASVEGAMQRVVSVARQEDDAGESALAIVGVFPGEASDGVQQRLRQRIRSLEEDVGDQVQTEEQVDVGGR